MRQPCFSAQIAAEATEKNLSLHGFAFISKVLH